jgi:hypothetical protein
MKKATLYTIIPLLSNASYVDIFYLLFYLFEKNAKDEMAILLNKTKQKW